MSLAKLKAMLLFFATHTNPTYLGKVKLMKLIYFADFLHVKKHATPITYDTYINLDKGPIPSSILNIINSAAEEESSSKLSDTISIEKKAGIEMQAVKANREINQEDLDLFTQTELEVLTEIANKFKDFKTEQIISASHEESPWKNTQYLQKIPYELATLDADSQVSAEEVRFAIESV